MTKFVRVRTQHGDHDVAVSISHISHIARLADEMTDGVAVCVLHLAGGGMVSARGTLDEVMIAIVQAWNYREEI